MVGVLFSSTNKSNFSGLGKSNSTERVNPQSVPTVKWFREVKFLAVPPLLTCKMENLYVSIQGSKVDDCVSKIICCKCASSTVTCGAGQNYITCWKGLEIYPSVTQLRMDRIRRYFAKLWNWGTARHCGHNHSFGLGQYGWMFVWTDQISCCSSQNNPG